MPIGILRLVYKTDPSGFLRPGDLEAVVEVGGLNPRTFRADSPDDACRKARHSTPDLEIVKGTDQFVVSE
jgi:hypothetical protein